MRNYVAVAICTLLGTASLTQAAPYHCTTKDFLNSENRYQQFTIDVSASTAMEAATIARLVPWSYNSHSSIFTDVSVSCTDGTDAATDKGFEKFVCRLNHRNAEDLDRAQIPVQAPSLSLALMIAEAHYAANFFFAQKDVVGHVECAADGTLDWSSEQQRKLYSCAVFCDQEDCGTRILQASSVEDATTFAEAWHNLAVSQLGTWDAPNRLQSKCEPAH